MRDNFTMDRCSFAFLVVKAGRMTDPQFKDELIRRCATVDVLPEYLELCDIKSVSVMDMTFDEMEILMNWCGHQRSDLWEDMSLQEILNIYRVSAEWDNWEVWALEEEMEAKVAWNVAVIDPGNKMILPDVVDGED